MVAVYIHILGLGLGLGLLQMANHEAITTIFGGDLPPGVTGMNNWCTILASNLDCGMVNEDRLFNLFSLYGNIARIKLLYDKRDHALVQMCDGFEAELAVYFLNGAELFRRRMEVKFAIYPEVTPGPDTYEYLDSNLNRFNHNVVKNYSYCCFPQKMIHISNLSQDITERDLVDHLEGDSTILRTKIFETNGKKQALVLFEIEEDATETIMYRHGSSLKGSIMGISFSQSKDDLKS